MDKRISILHIAECAGGVERYLQMLLPRLERKNFCQHFICSFNYNKEDYRNIVDGVEQMDLKQTFSPLGKVIDRFLFSIHDISQSYKERRMA